MQQSSNFISIYYIVRNQERQQTLDCKSFLFMWIQLCTYNKHAFFYNKFLFQTYNSLSGLGDYNVPGSALDTTFDSKMSVTCNKLVGFFVCCYGKELVFICILF